MQDKIIAAQLPTHSLSDDIETVKRVIAHIGGPTILVGHSYGGEAITNAAYTNPNVTGLIYIAAYIATPAMAQNMTGDNATMMGGNMTAGNMTGGSTGSRTIHRNRRFPFFVRPKI